MDDQDKDGSPSLDRANRLYFFSDRGAASVQNSIYISEWHGGHFSTAAKLSKEINAEPSDTSPWIAPDGKTLLFYSTREGGHGKANLYASFIEGGRWSKALNLGSIVKQTTSSTTLPSRVTARHFILDATGRFTLCR